MAGTAREAATKKRATAEPSRGRRADAAGAANGLLDLQRRAGNAAVVGYVQRLDDVSPLKPLGPVTAKSGDELVEDARIAARMIRAAVTALYGLQHDYTDNEGLISGISEALGFATRPSTSSYSAILTKARELEDEVRFGRDPVVMGRLASEAKLLLDQARDEWRQFIEDTERGTDSAIFTLEAIRDICIAVEVMLLTGGAAAGAAPAAGGSGIMNALGAAGRQLFLKGGATLLVKGTERAVTRGTEMAIGTRREFDVESFGVEVGQAGLEAGVFAFADSLLKPFTEKLVGMAAARLGPKLPAISEEVLKKAIEIAFVERGVDVGKKLLKSVAGYVVEQLGPADAKKVAGPTVVDVLAAHGVDYLKAILEDLVKGAVEDLTDPKKIADAIAASAK